MVQNNGTNLENSYASMTTDELNLQTRDNSNISSNNLGNTPNSGKTISTINNPGNTISTTDNLGIKISTTDNLGNTISTTTNLGNTIPTIAPGNGTEGPTSVYNSYSNTNTMDNGNTTIGNDISSNPYASSTPQQMNSTSTNTWPSSTSVNLPVANNMTQATSYSSTSLDAGVNNRTLGTVSSTQKSSIFSTSSIVLPLQTSIMTKYNSSISQAVSLQNNTTTSLIPKASTITSTTAASSRSSSKRQFSSSLTTITSLSPIESTTVSSSSITSMPSETTSSTSSSKAPYISSFASKNYMVYIYDQRYEFTDATTTFDADIPTKTKIPRGKDITASFAAPTSVITTDAAYYKAALAGTLDFNSKQQDARVRNGKIIGGVVGSIGGLIICLSICWFVFYTRKRRNRSNSCYDDDLTSIKDEKASYYGFTADSTPRKPTASVLDLGFSNQKIKGIFKKRYDTPEQTHRRRKSLANTNPFQDEFDFDKRLPSPPMKSKPTLTGDQVSVHQDEEEYPSIPHLLLPDSDVDSNPGDFGTPESAEQFSYVSSLNSYAGSSIIHSSVGDYSTLSPTSIHISDSGSLERELPF